MGCTCKDPRRRKIVIYNDILKDINTSKLSRLLYFIKVVSQQNRPADGVTVLLYSLSKLGDKPADLPPGKTRY
jgi:hypothetical protein